MTINIEGLGKITATKDALNWIQLLAFEASLWNKEKGYDRNYKNRRHIKNTIFDELDSAGYYDIDED